MITADNIRQWMERSGFPPLSSLEGGGNLRTRYVAFLALRHPDELQRFLQTESGGPYPVEELMLEALDETVRTRLREVLPEGVQWQRLEEWIKSDEDAYELINQLRPA